jgi:carnitine O-palmitoyltransferase 2
LLTDRYDKSFTLIVTADGQAAVNFEHAWGDGVAVMRFFNEVYGASTAMLSVTSPQPPADPPTRLAFTLPEDVKTAVVDAQRAFDATIARTDLKIVQVEGARSALPNPSS